MFRSALKQIELDEIAQRRKGIDDVGKLRELRPGRGFARNRERYLFLRWGQSAFQNFRVVPPKVPSVSVRHPPSQGQWGPDAKLQRDLEAVRAELKAAKQQLRVSSSPDSDAMEVAEPADGASDKAKRRKKRIMQLQSDIDYFVSTRDDAEVEPVVVNALAELANQ